MYLIVCHPLGHAWPWLSATYQYFCETLKGAQCYTNQSGLLLILIMVNPE